MRCSRSHDGEANCDGAYTDSLSVCTWHQSPHGAVDVVWQGEHEGNALEPKWLRNLYADHSQPALAVHYFPSSECFGLSPLVETGIHTKPHSVGKTMVGCRALRL